MTRPPPPQKPAGTPQEPAEQTDPGGPSAEVLAQARREANPGDATLVYDKNKGRARADSCRLVVIAGPRKGTEFSLGESPATVGRGSDNTFVIPDISVSRQHIRLERHGDGWVLFDHGSGNGTRVNGKQVEKYPLQHGDEIEMGDTRVQFVEPGGVVVRSRPPRQSVDEARPARRPVPGAWKARAPLYGAILLALAIVLAAGAVRRLQRGRLEAQARQHRDESRRLAQERFQEGVALLKQGRWVEARDKLKIAAELDGQDPEIARYLDSAENEAPRAQALSAARAALGRLDFAGAKAALAAIPEDSALAENAHDLSRQLGAALDAAVREARARVESGDTSGAAEILEPVLAADPARTDALAVKDALAAQKRTAPRRETARQEPARTQPAPPPSGDVQRILEAYMAGDVDGAIERAQSAQSPRASRMLADLKLFDAASKDAAAKRQAKRLPEAVRALETATAADRTIASGNDSPPGREVRKSLAALQVELAGSLSGDDSLPQQAAHLRAALLADPANDRALALLREAAEHAKEIYLRGYAAKDEEPDLARKAFRLVVETLPPSDETAQKARRWLEKLEGRTAKEE